MGNEPRQPRVPPIEEIQKKGNLSQIYDSIIRNSILSQFREPINMEEIEKLRNNRLSMVKIKFKIESNGKIVDKSGVGFFCKFTYEGIPFKKALFTNYHILNEESINLEKKIKLENLGKTIEITKERKVYFEQYT